MTEQKPAEIYIINGLNEFFTEKPNISFYPVKYIPAEMGDKLTARIAVLEKALLSIAKNTCCDKCQEAALVAQKALTTAECNKLMDWGVK